MRNCTTDVADIELDRCHFLRSCAFLQSSRGLCLLFHIQIQIINHSRSIQSFFQMSLLDQNWGASGNADDEAQDDNQTGRQVTLINYFPLAKKQPFLHL